MQNLSPDKFLLLKQNPSAKALVTSTVTYTFTELQQKVLAIASFFNKQNISSGERVGILGKNDVDFVLNILALWQISAIPIPLNWRLTETEIAEQLDQVNCRTILVQREFIQTTKIKNRKAIEYPFEIKIDNPLPIKEKLSPNDIAVIIFTSGSTNTAKGIMLSFSSLYNSALNSNQLLRYSRSDKWLASLPFYHIGGFSIITRSLLFGIPLIIPDSISLGDLKLSINKFEPTFISLVAAQLKNLVADGFSPNPELKNCLVGGGFSDYEQLMKARELGWPINIVYGSTETSSFVTALLKDEIQFKRNSVGRAVPTNRIQILDNDGNEVKPFEIGEVAVQTNSLMAGYLDDIETKKVIKNDFYFTGDIGYVDDEGYLFIEGRKNYLISTGGENVNPVEIENALFEHPLIEEVVVYPLRDKDWGEIVAASIVLKQKAEKVSADDIKKFLEGRVSRFKIPKNIFFEEQLPKTELGKIQKGKLIELHKFTSL